MIPEKDFPSLMANFKVYDPSNTDTIHVIFIIGIVFFCVFSTCYVKEFRQTDKQHKKHVETWSMSESDEYLSRCTIPLYIIF